MHQFSDFILFSLNSFVIGHLGWMWDNKTDTCIQKSSTFTELADSSFWK